jgi:multiple sugar transport system substrate-binding protein
MIFPSDQKQNFLAVNGNVAYSRRAFLAQSAVLTLSGITADLSLVGCTLGADSPTTTTITWASENDQFDICNKLAKHFTQVNNDNITVIHEPNQQPIDLYTKLQNGDETPDVLSLDVIWIDHFAHSNVLLPLTTWWNEQKEHYLPILTQAVTSTSGNEIWAVPFRTDIGLLFYRTDLVKVPPKTWDELVTMAQDAQKQHNISYGYVWQETGEGLLCNFVEVLSSFGGNVLDTHGYPILNRGDAAKKALNEMHRWINLGISPPLPVGREVYAEESARTTWAMGNAVFMRNWPYAIAMSNDAQESSVTANNFAVAPLPSNAKSCLGGWQLAINKNSRHQDAAWKFIKWMLDIDAQQYGAIMGSFAVAHKNIYTEPLVSYVSKRNPFFASFEPIIENGQSRPRTPDYLRMSKALQEHILKALNDPTTSASAVQSMQAELEKYLSKK